MRTAAVLTLMLLGAACGPAIPRAAAAPATPAAAKPAAAADAYTRARDAFLAGQDEEVLKLLTPQAIPKLRYRSHAALWAALSRARLDRRDEALAELAAYRAKNHESPFIDLVVDFYLGKVQDRDVTGKARTGQQKLEARFYVGAYRLLFDKEAGKAGGLLCEATTAGGSRTSEFRMAQALLKDLPDAPCRATAARAAEAEHKEPSKEPAAAAHEAPPGVPGEKLSALEAALQADSLGRSEEALGHYRAALREIKDPDAAAMVRSRIYVLSRDAADEQARAAVGRESDLSRTAGPENAVAVARFENLSDESRWAPLEKGLPALLASDLSQAKKLTVLERVELEAVLRELSLSRTEMFDSATAPRLGHLLRAGRVVVGTYMVTGDDRIELDARVVSVHTGRVEGTAHAAGRTGDFFGLEKDLAFALLDKLGVRLSGVERNTIEKQVPTKELAAFLAYSRGLDEEDRGNWSAAGRAYADAASRDASFREASAAATLLSRGSVSRGDLASALRGGMVAHAQAPAPARRAALLPDRVLARAFETDRTAGSGLLPNLETGEANERRDVRPTGQGTVIVSGRIP
ncbi:MAG TPA: CsgG/HfaB family protein [Candidatus Saccharimonadales bacterium]|nr:CsgG/HfaB family protein [Candidatus Saccharimonadales bacterium]